MAFFGGLEWGNDGGDHTTNFLGRPTAPGDYVGAVATIGLGATLSGGQWTSPPLIYWGGTKSNLPSSPDQFYNEVGNQLNNLGYCGFLASGQIRGLSTKANVTRALHKAGLKVRVVNGKIVLVPDSHDPNEITGPAGFGTQGFLQPIEPLPYRIDFTNESSATAPATAPAATVVVTDQLSSNLNLSTFQLGEIGFGSTVVQVPAGLASYSTEVTLPSTAPGAGPDGLIVDISAAVNPATGLFTWTFSSLDPTTLDIPINPFEGFLPPDDSEGDGEGFVTYTVQPTSSATTGTVINAQATVVFDTNAPINTKVVSNTVDATVPTGSVKPLAATTSTTSFSVSWSGSDGAGSGIASYNVFVSTNGGPFQPFQTGTTATSATFTGQIGDIRVLQRGHEQRRARPTDPHDRASDNQGRESHGTSARDRHLCRVDHDPGQNRQRQEGQDEVGAGA